MGRKIFPGLLQEAGLRVELHDDHFAQNTLDPEWLPVVGAKRWVVLTADGRIRYRGLETEALMGAGVRCFVLVGLAAGHSQLAKNFLLALPKIDKLLTEHHGPFIAKVYRDGVVEMGLDVPTWRSRR